MSTKKRSKALVAGIAAAGSAGLVAATLAVTAGIGSADPIEKTLNYTCPFPMIGNQNVEVTISTDIPSSIGVGEPTGEFDIVSVANAGQEATKGLNLVGAETIEGVADMEAHVEAPGVDLPVTVPNDIPKTDIPEDGNDLILENITGSTPSLTFDEPGQGKITLGAMLLTMTPRDENGEETGLGTFESDCTMVDGEDPLLHEFEITGEGGETDGTETDGTETDGTETDGTETDGTETDGTETDGTETDGGETDGGETDGGETDGGETDGTETDGTETDGGETDGTETDGGGGDDPIKLAFDLSGESYIKAPDGTVALDGDIKVDFDLAAGEHESELYLAPTQGDFTIMGFLQVKADVEFEQVGKTTGTFDGSNLTSHSDMYIKLPNITAWGFPIGGGEDCQTVEPASIDLEGEGFDPFSGGKLATDDYTIPPLENCGQMNDWISMFTAGPGNTIDMDLTSK